MEDIAALITVTIPRYLHELPIPTKWEQWGQLSREQWDRLAPFLTTCFITLFLLGLGLNAVFARWFSKHRRRVARESEKAQSNEGKYQHINQDILKDHAKVTNAVRFKDIEDYDKNMAYCRCWRSREFPFCDGSHNDWNKKTGDNCGPLIIMKPHNK